MTVDPAIRSFIYSFHIPLFFIISGFLYKRIPIKERAKKDWFSLLLPYLLINLCCMALRLTISSIREPDYLFFHHLLAQMGAILVGESIHAFGLEPVCGPTWFILAIALLHLMSYLLPDMEKGLRRYLWAGTIISAFCAGITWAITHWSISIPGPTDSAIMSFPFFWIGTLLSKCNIHEIPGSRAFLLLFFLTIATIFLNQMNGPIDINGLLYGKNLLIFYVCGITGTLMVLCLCILLERLNWTLAESFTRVISVGTILVLGFHRYGIIACEKFFELSSWQSIIASILILIAFYPIILLAIRFFPAFVGFRKL